MATEPDLLPNIGDRENQRLDFKQRAPHASLLDRLELAKDVAALANSGGGRLVVGASEEKSTLQSWAPLTNNEARETCEAYELAVRDFCLPAPIFVCQIVDSPSGANKLVLVDVNVQLGRLVGVRVKLDSAKESVGAEPAYRFPVRVGNHTRYFDPSNLPYSDERRVAAFFATFVQGDRVKLIAPSGHPGGVVERAVLFDQVDPIRGEFVVKGQDGKLWQPVPFADVRNVQVASGAGTHLVSYKEEARIRP